MASLELIDPIEPRQIVASLLDQVLEEMFDRVDPDSVPQEVRDSREIGQAEDWEPLKTMLCTRYQNSL